MGQVDIELLYKDIALAAIVSAHSTASNITTHVADYVKLLCRNIQCRASDILLLATYIRARENAYV